MIRRIKGKSHRIFKINMVKIISFLKKFRKVAEHLIILILYTVITILIFYPVTLNFSSSIGGMGPDIFPNAWSFWLSSISISDHNIKNFFKTDYLAYPNSSDMIINGIPILSLIIFAPFEWIMGLTFTYNLSIFLSFIISAYSTFLLAKYLTEDTYSSFIAGLIFAFCPFRLLRAFFGHTVLLRTEFMPLYIMFLLKFIKDINLKNSLLLVLFFILNIYNSIYIAIMLGLFSLVIIIYNIRTIFRLRNLKYVILILLLTLILSFPYIQAFSGEGYRYFSFSSMKFSSEYSADLMAFILPPSFNPFWGDKLKDFNIDFTWSEHFLGYTVIILLIYGFIKIRTEKLWIITGITFLLLSMGPTLKILGKTGDNICFFPVDDLKVTVPLPYIIFYYLCPLIRNPGRFTLFTVFSMSILASYSIKDLLKKTGSSKILVTALLTLFILMEFSIAMPLTDSKVPEIYYSIGKEKDDFTVLEIPVFLADGWHHTGVYDNRIMYYQTVHNKKILNSYLGRLPESIFYYYSNIPVIGTIMGLEENSKIEKNRIVIDRIWLQRVLHFFNIKYIIFQPPFNNSNVKDYIRNMMKLKAIDTGTPEVYEVFREEIDLSSINIDINDPGSILYMLEGWEWYEENGNYYYKSNFKKSIVMVPLNSNMSYNMTLFLSASENSFMTVMLNGRELGEIKLTDKECKYEFSLSDYKFNRLNKFEFIQKNFQKEKVFLKVRQINFSTNK